MQGRSFTSMMNLIFKGLALAMGVAVVILSFLGGAAPSALITMLGIGLCALGLWALQSGDK